MNNRVYASFMRSTGRGTPLLIRMLEVYVPLVIACAAVDRMSCYNVAAAAVSSSAALIVSATVAALLQLLLVTMPLFVW